MRLKNFRSWVNHKRADAGVHEILEKFRQDYPSRGLSHPMAAIRIQFPGRSAASLVELKGGRITIGRSPANTIQILDRSMSLRHAELIDEEGHYRLHDVGSTNGMFVNGQQVEDYHLREKCTLAFGTFECEFLPELPADSCISLETLPSRAELIALQEQNSDLKVQLVKMREEMEVVKNEAALQARERASSVSREQYESTVAERESVTAILSEREKEVEQLQTDLSATLAERERLTQALDGQKAVLTALPTPADIELLRVENADLKARLEAQAEDLARLQAEVSSTVDLCAEHMALKAAHNLVKSEAEKLRTELSSSHDENSGLNGRIGELTRELEEVRGSHESLVQGSVTLVPPEEHQKLIAEHTTLKNEFRRMEEEIASLKKELERLEADRGSLQRTSDERRMELDALPKLAEFESLQIVNAKLEAQVRELARTVESLRKVQADQSSHLAASISMESHNKVVAAHEALQGTLQQQGAELGRVKQQLVEFEALRESLEQTLHAREREIEALRKRVESESPSSLQSLVPGQVQPSSPHEEASSGTAPELSGEQIEEALGKLGFVLHPVRRDVPSPPKTG